MALFPTKKRAGVTAINGVRDALLHSGALGSSAAKNFAYIGAGIATVPFPSTPRGAADALEALSKDAQRYRFLRGLPDGALYQSAVNEYLDEAIDAARAQETEAPSDI
jgi:hypothetical protein